MTQPTWNPQAAPSAEWNTPDNWKPAEVPGKTACFADSPVTSVTFSATSGAEVESIEFSDNASAYSFTFGPSDTPALTITGNGITNHSQQQQSFIVAATSSGYQDPQLKFINSASAGGDSLFYCTGPETEQGYGGGVICFCNNATAGSASYKVWTGAGTPPEHSTVGGEVSFCDSSTAATARFKIYGSLGADGDTFGNVVFHQNATAANASFINVGGTVSGGDGGNTQFYGESTAACGIFDNWGGTHDKANGGDVAFDSCADGGQGHFYNYAASVAGAYGGVTSFNNNPPHVAEKGASAGNGTYINYGARNGEQGGGGHLEFSARYGSPTGANATIINYGSDISQRSSAGHTIFSINLPTSYFPTAGEATIHNHPAPTAQGSAGFTEFSIYGSGAGDNVPDAGNGTFLNLGATVAEAAGGYTQFSGRSSAGSATLIAYAGTNSGYGGKIAFYDNSQGGTATIQLFGNGELDIGNHTQGVTIGDLELNGGIIITQLGSQTPTLTVSGTLTLNSDKVRFSFWKKAQGGFEFNKTYTVLCNANLSGLSADLFAGNSIEDVEPTFVIVGNALQVSFLKD